MQWKSMPHTQAKPLSWVLPANRSVLVWFPFFKNENKRRKLCCVGWHDERKVHHTIPFPFTSAHAFVTSFLRFVFFLYYTERTKQLRTPTLLPFILCFGF
jgi:hypothetical protein